MLDKPEIWIPALAAFLSAVLGALVAWLLGHFTFWRLLGFALRVRPVAWVKSKWRRWRARLIPIRAYPASGENECMRQFTIKEIYALDGKGKAIADICLLYTSPSPRDGLLSRMPSSA